MITKTINVLYGKTVSYNLKFTAVYCQNLVWQFCQAKNVIVPFDVFTSRDQCHNCMAPISICWAFNYDSSHPRQLLIKVFRLKCAGLRFRQCEALIIIKAIPLTQPFKLLITPYVIFTRNRILNNRITVLELWMFKFLPHRTFEVFLIRRM